MNRAALAAVVLIAAGAGLALRGGRLAQRPMHGDEAVHAYKFNELWTTGRYRYDPFEYHGPTLYYLTYPAVWLSGARDWSQMTEADFRRVTVAIGVGLILLVLLVADGLGRAATAWAAVFTALSPAFTFYSRYYIQETLLVFCTFLALAAGWRYVRTRRLVWALVAGGAVGLMHATKETCVIALTALVGAAVLSVWWTRGAERFRVRAAVGGHAKALVVGALTACGVSALLFSAFFTDLAGPWNSLCALSTYWQRAAGGIHEHPAGYYLGLLLYGQVGRGPVWTEGLIVGLAVVGIIAALRAGAVRGARSATCENTPRASGDGARGGVRTAAPGLLCLVAFYTLLMTLIYALIPYKTPWCALGFLHGMILMAGVGAATLVRLARYRAAQALVCAALAGGAAHLGWQARQLTTRCESSQVNPYVYAHPVGDVVRLAAYVERLAEAAPAGRPILVKVFAENCWPLPWYLRRMAQVGYWESVPEEPDADAIVVSQHLQPTLAAALRGAYRADAYGLRPDEVLWVYVRAELRARFEERLRTAPASTPGAPSP